MSASETPAGNYELRDPDVRLILQVRDDSAGIGVIRSSDPYDILRTMGTAAASLGLPTEALIARLQEWEARHQSVVFGADLDWVTLEFAAIPRDLASFARGAHGLFPDSVDGGPRATGELGRSLQRTGRLYLWWS